MSSLILGGSGFIGTRVARLLVGQGEAVAIFDLNPNAPALSDLAGRVNMIRGDITRFHDVMEAMLATKPDRVLNLCYFLGSEQPPHSALQLNIVGMDNCFEAARLAAVRRVVFASSLAVNGKQKHYGDRPVTEDDFRHGEMQYAVHKIFNEEQAEDYRAKYGMSITSVRPANVSGFDKVSGSVDHVNCIVQPALGKAVSFPFKDTMRCPIHVDDIAEVFRRVMLADNPRYNTYNTGGHSTSLGDLASLVREFLPQAKISFEHESGARAESGNHLIENLRLKEEFGVQYPPYRRRVLQMINEVRVLHGVPPIEAA